VRAFGGSWSKSKLDCVEEYARAYLKVMQEQRWYTLEYVDAFAGRGTQTVRTRGVSTDMCSFFGDESERIDTEEFLIGSALRVLGASSQAKRPFDRFTFIDADRDSCAELRSVVASGYPALTHAINIVCDDANAALQQYVSTVDWSATRSLVFLDPYGLEVEWDLICKLADTKACDVWYLFPLGGVIRMMKNDGKLPDAWSSRLDKLFGSHDWHDEFYKPSPLESLFGPSDEILTKDATTEHVVAYVRQRLGDVFAAVSDAAILRNSKRAPLFALVLGVSNPSSSAQDAALRIANHLVKGLNQP
jgi:three-Cys-motif partner protein